MYQFLETNIPDIIEDFIPIKLSAKSIQMLQPMFQHMDKGAIAYKNASISCSPIDFRNQSHFPHGRQFDYCPDEIKTHIEKMLKIGTKFTFSLQGHSINIHIICSKRNTNNEQFMKDVMKRIYIWLYLAFQYSTPQCSQIMNIYLYMTNLKKTLPAIGKPIKEINANTAFTTSCQQSTEMHLFREEEWFKVFIHETFHNLGLDFSEFDHTKTNAEILSIFPVKSDVRLFETYCEMWAETLQCMFISFYKEGSREPDKLIQETEKLLQKERIFSMFQCAKILHFYGIDYINLHEHTKESHHIRLTKYKEETHVLSYYIIKSIFMFYVNDFIEWSATNNNNSLNFNKEPNKLHNILMDYCNLLRKHYSKPEYKNIIESLDKWLSENFGKHHSNHMMSTLRMTINEL
jgi:hypothetical protein